MLVRRPLLSEIFVHLKISIALMEDSRGACLSAGRFGAACLTLFRKPGRCGSSSLVSFRLEPAWTAQGFALQELHFRRRFCFGSAIATCGLTTRGARLARTMVLSHPCHHAERTPCQLCTAQGHVTRLHAHRKGKLPGARLEIVAHGLSPYINLLPDHLSTVYVGRCEQADEDAHDACSACYETCCTRR